MAVVLLASCAKETDGLTSEGSSDEKTNPKSQVFSELGEQHNAILEYAIGEVDFKTDSIPVLAALDAIKNMNWDFSQSQIDLNTFMEMSLDTYSLMDSLGCKVAHWSQNPYSVQATVILQNTLNIFKNVQGVSNIDIIYSNLDDLRNVARNQLSGDELSAVINTIDVAKSSAYFWAPIDIGGLGYWDYCNEQKAWNWGNAVLGDAWGSLSYWTGVGVVGIVAATVPGPNVAIFTGWACATAIGSVAGGFGLK